MKIRHLNVFALAAALALTAVTAHAAGPSKAPAGNTGYISSTGNVLIRNDGIFVRCSQCGTVQSIERNITQGRDHGTLGTVIGGVAGGVLGNQVGKGKGNTLATIAGAVGGGVVGNKIGTGGGGESYTLRLKMGDGGISNVTVPDASSIREGDIVQIDNNGNVTRVQ
ncbi:glycine zipper 2TM domain-containing protein [Dyella tabacisoli]|uniref:Glycine zipper 2TM domain-containing protein n=1 Tax=Dyella tabacisoli TaxID=2282381 RepID=A0A369UK48_9GAMM|nr:glycine zipper 2TM domain-containing protein [Dyella tabacisoli]RDD81132.1 glycine zipper 2TM domain-containing protein [Dyella tabacisoli]